MSDVHYPTTVGGQPLSEEQKRLFDQFLDSLAALKAYLVTGLAKVDAKLREAEAEGVDPKLIKELHAELSPYRSVAAELSAKEPSAPATS